jgi:transposase, IS5 family
MSLGQVGIASIEFDPKCRDDITQILLGLQYIYVTPDLRERVFEILQHIVPNRTGNGLTGEQRAQKADPDLGRSGMDQWKILVLGVLRLGLNTDYDRIRNLANNHNTVRQMLEHDDWYDTTKYSLQTIKDNVGLFTPEILDQVSHEVIKAGHALVKKNQSAGQTKEETKLLGRCDSFVVKTNVKFPTDITLFYDAVRKGIAESAALAQQCQFKGWRQYIYNIKQFKKQLRIIQQLKQSRSKNEADREIRDLKIQLEHFRYIVIGKEWVEKSDETLQQAKKSGVMDYETVLLEQYLENARILMNQIHRRVILGETIPHDEKIFSIFEPHTEWISKGKAGVPVELGLRVCIMEDQHQFIIHHKVMEKETDDKIAVEMVTESQKKFPQLTVASFDKGFHSPKNQVELKEYLEQVIMPKKGRLCETDKQREGSEGFKSLRHQHSAVESAINALEHCGLDICPDHGLNGFKRYVSLAVLSRNIKRLGAIIRQQEREKEQRKRGSYKKVA